MDSLQIIGRSPSITRLRASLDRLAADPKPLIIIGEQGVGKTLLAKAIHARSPRTSVTLKSINFKILSEREQRVALLGGGPPELTTTRRSALEFPTTLILKHVDCAAPFLQERLAEALQAKRFTRLGTESVQYVLSRPVFLLRSSPSTLSRRGKLTDPLFSLVRRYKQVTIPPLRRRTEDIPLLVDHFVNGFLDTWQVNIANRGRSIYAISSAGRMKADFLRLLQQQRWEENILQLKAYVRSLLLLNHRASIQEREKIEVMKMMLMIEEGGEFSLRESLAAIEQGMIQRAIIQTGGHQTRAARLLGISDREIRRR